MVTVGAPATDWANDGLFGDGWHLLGIGQRLVTTPPTNTPPRRKLSEHSLGMDTEAENFDADAALAEMKAFSPRRLRHHGGG